MKKFGKRLLKKKEKQDSVAQAFDFFCGKVEIKLDRSQMPVEVIIFGVKSFKTYLPENISVNLGKTNIDILGDNLYCSTYSGGCVEISGRITGVKFSKT